MRFFNDKLLESTRTDSPVFVALEKAIIDSRAREDLDEQARNVGKAQGLKTEVISLSKTYILGLRKSNCVDKALVDAMLGAWGELLEVHIARDIREGLIADAGQEMAEALICQAAADYIFQGDASILFTMPGSYDIDTRFWLAGLLDSITEMSKLVNHRLRDLRKNSAARAEVRARYLEFAESAYNILAGFTGVPSTTIDASRRRGQGFQSKLARVGNHLELKANESVLLEDMALVAGGVK